MDRVPAGNQVSLAESFDVCATLVLIQFLRVLDHFFVMLVPLGDGVVVLRNSCHGKNSVSEFLKGLFLRQIGEHCFGPIYGRHADDAPLALVVHGVADQVRHLGVVGHVGGFDLLAVHAALIFSLSTSAMTPGLSDRIVM